MRRLAIPLAVIASVILAVTPGAGPSSTGSGGGNDGEASAASGVRRRRGKEIAAPRRHKNEAELAAEELSAEVATELSALPEVDGRCVRSMHTLLLALLLNLIPLNS